MGEIFVSLFLSLGDSAVFGYLCYIFCFYSYDFGRNLRLYTDSYSLDSLCDPERGGGEKSFVSTRRHLNPKRCSDLPLILEREDKGDRVSKS